jgi:hypothetical protein
MGLKAVHVAVKRCVADRHFDLFPVVNTSEPNLFESAMSMVPRCATADFPPSTPVCVPANGFSSALRNPQQALRSAARIANAKHPGTGLASSTLAVLVYR